MIVRYPSAALLVAVALCVADEARAQWDAPVQQRTIGVLVEGASTKAVAAIIEESLGAGFLMVDEMTLREALALGGRRALGPRPKDLDATVEALVAACAEAGLDGLIYAHVSGSSKAGYTVWALVVDRDGGVHLDDSASAGAGKKRNKKVSVRWNREAVSALLQPGIDGLRARPPAEARRKLKPATVDATSREAPWTRPSGVAATYKAPPPGPPVTRLNAPVVVKAGAELSGRNFDYNQPVTSNLRSYAVSFAPLFGLEAEAYPFAGTHVPVLTQIGWYGEYAQAFQVQSTFANDDGPPVQNVWRRWQVGLRGRVPVSSAFGLVLQGTFGHTGYSFEFARDDAREREVPDVRYNVLRGGLEARVKLGFLELFLGGGAMRVLAGGRVSSEYFPRAAVGGVDGAAGISWPILSRLSVDLGAKYTRYFYDMNPQPWDRYVAGGALDQYVGASLGLVYLVGTP